MFDDVATQMRLFYDFQHRAVALQQNVIRA